MPTFDKDMGDLEQFFELDLAGFREMRRKAAAWDELRVELSDAINHGGPVQTREDAMFMWVLKRMDELESKGGNDGPG